RDAANAATQMPSIRDFRTTNEVALGATFDDNSSPVTILRTSLGTFAGGPVAQKSWPAQYGQTLPTGLIDGKHLMIPTAPHGPLPPEPPLRRHPQASAVLRRRGTRDRGGCVGTAQGSRPVRLDPPARLQPHRRRHGRASPEQRQARGRERGAVEVGHRRAGVEATGLA